MKFRILLFIACCSLSACVEITDLDERGDANEMHYHALELPEPNRYSVVIPLQSGELAVRKGQDFNKLATAPMQVFVHSQTQLVDENVVAGERYYYQFGDFENGSLHITRAVVVQIPKDRVFGPGHHDVQPEDLDATMSYGRIFFLKGSKVRTNGMNWILRARKLISQNAEIYSFLEGQEAATGADGRSGGEIRIIAHEIQGVLNLTMRGEHGGKGIPGAEIPGRAAQGSAGVPGKGRYSSPRSHADAEYCTQQAVSPGDGAPGVRKGNRGSDGGRGGDSGNVFFDVGEMNAGMVQVNFYEGVGGLPGDGGPGERGGEPGEFNEKKNFGACKFRKAHEGPRGPQGEQGSSGLPGLRGKVCRQLGKKLDCRQGT